MTTNEPASFWTAIANNPEYGCDQRQRAALQLFARHFHSGMTIGNIGRMLNHPTWLELRGIAGGPTTGPRPPGFQAGDDLVFLNVRCGSERSRYAGIWLLSAHGRMSPSADLFACLEGQTTNQALASIKVDGVSSSEAISGAGVLYNAWGIPPKVVRMPKAGEDPTAQP
jgi:hypothetical protein